MASPAMTAESRADYLKKYLETPKEKSKKKKKSSTGHLRIIEENTFLPVPPPKSSVEKFAKKKTSDKFNGAQLSDDSQDEDEKLLANVKKEGEFSKFKSGSFITIGEDDSVNNSTSFDTTSENGANLSKISSTTTRLSFRAVKDEPPASPPSTSSLQSSSALKISKKSSTRKARRDDDGDSDISPPRGSQKRGRDVDGDNSPSQRKSRQDDDGDHSPPRRKSRQDDDGDNRVRRRRPDNMRNNEDDNSPPRRHSRRCDDGSESRRSRGDTNGAEAPLSSVKRELRDADDFDNSPPRRKRRADGSDSDASPPRRSSTTHLSSSSSRHDHHYRNGGGRRSENGPTIVETGGARRAVKHESSEQKPNEEEADQMDDGRFAEPRKRVTLFNRNARFGKPPEDLERKERESAKQKEWEAKYEKWSRGVQQTKKRESELEEMSEVAQEGFARYADDEAMNEHLKEKIHEELDPMTEFYKTKQQKIEMKTGVVYPKYKGHWPPNRFGIAPGYRWDGVNRSNGFEAKIAAAQNKRRAEEAIAYRSIVECEE